MSVPLHPVADLKAAVRARLAADADVAALVGSAIHDSPPRGTEPPYVTFGDATASDAGTVENEGTIVDLVIVAVAAERGSAASLRIAAAIGQALAAPGLALADHHLGPVDIRQISVRHDPAATQSRALIRLRAFTEPKT